ncbi:hypothetical protein THAOC_02136 [Thalassiosira oceanica]|uniref:Uncharacterized protein n=1 Tax=Thalassiosira oceanica TaxID=159749 RepID=K0TFF7_THAOC|nr:hypothetical protein THAOC_02136 [Thalassiosira oceanica]|eukprot:EJK76120.1 hypothetical protein THAOC_02136 [Thalassiosira oceanica]
MPANRRRKPRRSNPGLSLSRDTLFELPGIVSPDEAEELIRAINNETYRQWSPEGYDRRNRVQRFAPLGRVDAGKKSMEDVFGWIFDRIAAAAALPSQAELKRPAEVVVVEHTATSCQSRVNTFEQLQLTSPGDSSSYVATLVLLNDCIYHIEKPARRDAECWDVAHPVDKYSSNIVMGRNSVVFKTGESLWEWRGRYVGIQPIDDSPSEGSDGNDGNDVDVLSKAWKTKKKLKTFKERWITVSFRFFEETPGQDPAMHLPVEQLEKTGRPPHHLPDLLTVIVTTSPVRSNPSTALLEQTFSTFFHAGKGFLECPKVVICDGCRILEGEEKKDDGEESGAGCPPKVTRKYSNIKQNLRNGIASTDQASNYTEFKRRLREICCEADVSSPFFNTSVVELEERQGYGFALRHALRHCVSTPYVCVIQHDRTFMRETPIDEVIQVMLSNPGVKYVGINQKSNLNYVDIFSGKYGRRAVEEYKSMILRPPQLNIGAASTARRARVPMELNLTRKSAGKTSDPRGKLIRGLTNFLLKKSGSNRTSTCKRMVDINFPCPPRSSGTTTRTLCRRPITVTSSSIRSTRWSRGEDLLKINLALPLCARVKDFHRSPRRRVFRFQIRAHIDEDCERRLSPLPPYYKRSNHDKEMTNNEMVYSLMCIVLLYKSILRQVTTQSQL